MLFFPLTPSIKQVNLFCEAAGCVSVQVNQTNVYHLRVTHTLTLPFLSCVQSNNSMMFTISHLVEHR